MRVYQSATGEWIATDDDGRKVRGASHADVERRFMDNELKVEATGELRALTAEATAVFDKINVWLIKNERFGFVGTPPDDPIIDQDYADTIHAGVTVAQFYGVVAFFAGLVASVDSDTAKLLARFGKPAASQRGQRP